MPLWCSLSGCPRRLKACTTSAEPRTAIERILLGATASSRIGRWLLIAAEVLLVLAILGLLALIWLPAFIGAGGSGR